MRDRKFSSEQLSHISPDVAKATAAARAKSKAHRAASDALDASVLAAAAGQGDWEAQKRGLRRGAAFLEWLHSDVDARPIAPLDDYRYEFDEELAAKAMRKEASEEANAAAVKQARDNDAHTIAQRALQARRLNKQMNRPPPGLGALDRRLWAAYCEHETDEVGGGLTKMGFDAAFAAAGLMAETSQTANARWRRAELAKSGRVVWVEFRRLGNQLKALEELNQTEAAAARENKRVATDLAAASAIQARVRGNATREQTDAAILERRRAEQRMLTDEQTRARYESAYGIKGASVPTAAFAADTYGSAALARPGDGGAAPTAPAEAQEGRGRRRLGRAAARRRHGARGVRPGLSVRRAGARPRVARGAGPPLPHDLVVERRRAARGGRARGRPGDVRRVQADARGDVGLRAAALLVGGARRARGHSVGGGLSCVVLIHSIDSWLLVHFCGSPSREAPSGREIAL